MFSNYFSEVFITYYNYWKNTQYENNIYVLYTSISTVIKFSIEIKYCIVLLADAFLMYKIFHKYKLNSENIQIVIKLIL